VRESGVVQFKQNGAWIKVKVRVHASCSVAEEESVDGGSGVARVKGRQIYFRPCAVAKCLDSRLISESMMSSLASPMSSLASPSHVISVSTMTSLMALM